MTILMAILMAHHCNPYADELRVHACWMSRTSICMHAYVHAVRWFHSRCQHLLAALDPFCEKMDGVFFSVTLMDC